MAGKPHILYLSYDGMTDSVAQSQVLPYLFGLRAKGYRFTLLSFEKKDRFAQEGARIGKLIDEHQIEWVHLPFSTRPPLLAKVWDLWRMKRTALRLGRKNGFDLIHCRSYPPAMVGRKLARRWGIGYLFDMRGFWVDERVDGGMWNLGNPIYRWAFRRYKRKEAALVRDAAAIVSLTEAGREQVKAWPSYTGAPFEVIPCGTDLSLFTPIDAAEKRAARQTLGWPQEGLVLGYLGSLGQWYPGGAMGDFIGEVYARHPQARFLVLTRDDTTELRERAAAKGVPADRLLVKFAPRYQVRAHLAALDASWLFFRPAFSQKGRSPIKLGELMALGIPVICNAGTGDVDQVVREAQAGLVLPDLSEPSLAQAAEQLDQIVGSDKAPMLAFAANYYDLGWGVENYDELYQKLLHR